MTAVDALQAALEVEHQVVFGYGLVGARLRGRQRDECVERLAAHATRRDQLAELVRAAGGRPTPGSAAYGDPIGAVDAAGARELAEILEDAAAGAAWDLVAASAANTGARRLGVQALGDSATWSVRWRAYAGDLVPPPLPGEPDPPYVQPSTSPTSSSSVSTTPSGSTS
jgi:hypothetical protein